jgi:homoserine O-acetyltransferase
MKFPHYDYADMVAAQHALTASLGVQKVRLVMGTSMGCMHAFVWGETYPDGVQALMPLACLPTEIAGRNRLWRAMVIDAIRKDPAWMGGDYKAEPLAGLRNAEDLLIIAGAAPVRMQRELPTRATADAYAQSEPDKRAAAADANDMLYYVDASRTYDPSKDLEKITAPMTWVNSADDFINPPELGIAEREARRLRTAKFVLIPTSDKTHGHGTHTWAALWKDELAALLKRSE